MKSLIMFVYGDITTDARVQRAADALSHNYDLTLISSFCNKSFSNPFYKNIFVGGKSKNTLINLFLCIISAKNIIKRERPDIVYCHDYYSTILASLIINNRRLCKKVVYDAHELFVPYEKYTLDTHQFFFYLFERYIIHRVDLLIGANQERVQIMCEHYNLSRTPVVVRNISQLEICYDQETTKIMKRLNDFFLLDGITLVYAGCVSRERKIDSLLKSALKIHNQVKVLIVGGGDQLMELIELIDFSIKNPKLKVEFTGAVPYTSLGAILSKCDVGYLVYPTDCPNNIFCASNKIYEYASVSLPIIANNNPTVKKILEGSGIGFATDNFDEGLTYIIEHINEMKRNCISFSDNNSWSKEKEILLNAINTIS